MRRKWDKESIKSAIIAIHLSGGHLSYTSIVTSERALLQAAVRYYGTWEAAVNYTGLQYDNYRRHRKHVPTDDITQYRVRHNRKRPKSLFD